MVSEVYSIDELKTLLIPAFDAYPVRRGYVFGSYSRGEATEKSDIDLFVEPSDGFKSYEVCGILSRAMDLTGKGVECYSSLDFDKNAPIYKIITKLLNDIIGINSVTSGGWLSLSENQKVCSRVHQTFINTLCSIIAASPRVMAL